MKHLAVSPSTMKHYVCSYVFLRYYVTCVTTCYNVTTLLRVTTVTTCVTTLYKSWATKLNGPMTSISVPRSIVGPWGWDLGCWVEEIMICTAKNLILEFKTWASTDLRFKSESQNGKLNWWLVFLFLVFNEYFVHTYEKWRWRYIIFTF